MKSWKVFKLNVMKFCFHLGILGKMGTSGVRLGLFSKKDNKWDLQGIGYENNKNLKGQKQKKQIRNQLGFELCGISRQSTVKDEQIKRERECGSRLSLSLQKKKRFLRVEWITSTEWLLVWWWWWVWLPQKWKLMPIKVGPSTSYLNIMDSVCKSFLLLISIITEWCWKLDLLQLQCTLCHASRALQSCPVKNNLISDPKKKRQGETFFCFSFFLFFRLQEKRRRTFFSAMM